MNWGSEQENEFKAALCLKRGSGNSAPQNLLERSLPYLYLNTSERPATALALFVYEAALAPLMQTPLAFIHQALSSISATIADSLYHSVILPVLGSYLDHESAGFDTISSKLQAEIRTVLFSSEFRGAVGLWRMVEFRRQRILMAANLCCGGTGTFYQMGECSQTQSVYVVTAAVLFPEFDPNDLVPESILWANTAQPSLSKESRHGFQIATALNQRYENARSVDLAALLAHHVAYERCALLDCADSDFERFVSGLALSADHRFACLAQNTQLLTRAVERQDEGREALQQLRLLVPWLADYSAEERSFSQWIHAEIINSQIVRAVLGDEVADLSNLPAIDTWCDCLMPLRETPLPILCDNGAIVGASAEEENMIKIDLVRGRRLRIMSHIYNAMSH